MKLNKQKVFALALAVCLIATLSMGSLAWFTDSDSVTNDFLIAGSENQDPDAVFSVDVWERNDPNSQDKLDYIEYPNILPGDDWYKEVNVENTGSYEQYIRAIVTVSDAHIWQEIFGLVYVPLNEIATDLNADFEAWSTVYDADNDTLTYVLYYKNILAVDGIANLFTNVAIPEKLDRDQAAEMAGGFQIIVTADAVQTKNVGDNAPAAFATVDMAVEAGNSTINLTAENIADVLALMANSEDAEVALDLTGIVLDQAVTNQGTLEITGGTLTGEVVFKNEGTATLNGVSVEATSTGYAMMFVEGSTAVLNDVAVDSAAGNLYVIGGSEVTVNGGNFSNAHNTNSGQRYSIYAAQAGTVVTVNDGEFFFDEITIANQRKASYVCADYGAIVYINGGTFGGAPTHPNWKHPIYTANGGQVIITGGTFGFNPTEWVAEGYEAIQNGSTWTVQAK